MQHYDINNDLSDDRNRYLVVIHLVTLFIPFLTLVSLINSTGLSLNLWVPGCLLVTLLISHVLRRRANVALASWTYLVGLFAALGLALWQFGPNTAVYYLMVIPVALGTLLISQKYVIPLTIFTCAFMFSITALLTNVLMGIQLTWIPCFVCIVVGSVIHIYFGGLRETVYWATDIQQKDARRAELFYQQKEQLADALRQLTHAKSSLETAHRELEEAQRRTEQASQGKSVFLSNMSHELRTPLNVVIGYTSAMLTMPQLYDNLPLPERYRTDIQLIKDNGYYLLGLINDVLDLSKIEAGKLTLTLRSENLSDLFSAVIAMSIGLVKDKPIQIRPDYGDLPQVWADSMRVRQILLNLMSNAVKFTATGSVTLRARVEDRLVRISVIDTGIGIPEKALAQIFDRFEQAAQDTDKHYGGTGLGLDISRRLVRMQGGELIVQSVVGRGSTFSFTLPISPEAAPQEPALPGNSGELANALIQPEDVEDQSILLIEDDADLRQTIHQILSDNGYLVIDAKEGSQALETAAGLLPDVILLDAHLSGMSGWDVLEKLRQQSDTAAIPVLTWITKDDKPRLAESDTLMYLCKPFASDELLACVHRLRPVKVLDEKVRDLV